MVDRVQGSILQTSRQPDFGWGRKLVGTMGDETEACGGDRRVCGGGFVVGFSWGIWLVDVTGSSVAVK